MTVKSQPVDSSTIKMHIGGVWWSYMRFNSDANTTLWLQSSKEKVLKNRKTGFVLNNDQTYQFTQVPKCASDKTRPSTGK